MSALEQESVRIPEQHERTELITKPWPRVAKILYYRLLSEAMFDSRPHLFPGVSHDKAKEHLDDREKFEPWYLESVVMAEARRFSPGCGAFTGNRYLPRVTDGSLEHGNSISGFEPAYFGLPEEEIQKLLREESRRVVNQVVPNLFGQRTRLGNLLIGEVRGKLDQGCLALLEDAIALMLVQGRQQLAAGREEAFAYRQQTSILTTQLAGRVKDVNANIIGHTMTMPTPRRVDALMVFDPQRCAAQEDLINKGDILAPDYWYYLLGQMTHPIVRACTRIDPNILFQ